MSGDVSGFAGILHKAVGGGRLSESEALSLADCADLSSMMRVAASLRDAGFGERVSYSKKVFIPLTKLCRDVCHYCTFAHPPRKGERAFLTIEEVLAIAREGAAAGCHEALFTLGDRPEARYRIAREELADLGSATTLTYLGQAAEAVRRETGLLPHLNPGLMTAEDFAALRPVAASMGLMLETAAERLSERGGPHFGSPDKQPALRLAMLRAAAEAAVPFTTGILIGIGETRRERIEALLAIRAVHETYGNIQEIIVQNFRAKAGTKMQAAAEPTLDEHLWTVAVARLVFGAGMSIQAPPNLVDGSLPQFVAAGINDWGGVSPVTPDHVNPERPWPNLERLAEQTAAGGKQLVERLTIYPSFLADPDRWLSPAMRGPVLAVAGSEGYAREDGWLTGLSSALPVHFTPMAAAEPAAPLRAAVDSALAGEELDEASIASMFSARGRSYEFICEAADSLRAATCGDTVTYVVTRNINYTNVCTYRCQFCAFSKGKLSENLRGRPYDLPLDEIVRRTVEAWDRGAVEVCLQGGIHPDYTGETYLAILRAIKDTVPDMHVHAFSPLEVSQGAATIGLSVRDYLIELKAAGLGSLPGTAAEILDDEVRAVLCPDKINTAEWLDVVGTAHEIGLRTTSTIMFGHVDRPVHWARHLLRLRRLQQRTGGLSEFVPLPFVAQEAPIYLKGRSRRGPTWRETVLMHAVARLALNPLVTNIQTSWVKLGPEGAAACLNAGANDLGGTLMNESITRAAGAAHGQEMPPEAMERVIRGIGRNPRQRTTLYGAPMEDRRSASFGAAPLSEPINPAPVKRQRVRLSA